LKATSQTKDQTSQRDSPSSTEIITTGTSEGSTEEGTGCKQGYYQTTDSLLARDVQFVEFKIYLWVSFGVNFEVND
jgi:hypothetical protein